MKISRSIITNGVDLQLNEDIQVFSGETYDLELSVSISGKAELMRRLVSLSPKLMLEGGLISLKHTLEGNKILLTGSFKAQNVGEHRATLILKDDLVLPSFPINAEESVKETNQVRNIILSVTKDVNDRVGSKWYDGVGTPSNLTGIDNDYYLDLNSSDIYRKEYGSWERIGNIRGTDGKQGLQGKQGIQGKQGEKGAKGDKGDKGDTGATSRWYDGIGLPPTNKGKNDDYYLRLDSGDIFLKQNNVWERRGSLTLPRAFADSGYATIDYVDEVKDTLLNTIAELTTRIEALTTRVEALENQQNQQPTTPPVDIQYNELLEAFTVNSHNMSYDEVTESFIIEGLELELARI